MSLSLEDWKQLARQWKDMSLAWERDCGEAHKAGARATSMLLAAAITHSECPHLSEYSVLLRELLEAAEGLYVTPQFDTPDQKFDRLVSAHRALRKKLNSDGLR